MNTYLVSTQPAQLLQTGARRQFIPTMTVTNSKFLAFFSAAMATTAFFLLFVWVVGMVTNNLIAAGTWGLGSIFLGLATDSRKWLAICTNPTAACWCLAAP